MWRNTRSGWGLVSILVHWLSALAILGLFALGWWMTGLGYYDDWYNRAPWIHKSLGMLVLGVSILRLLWRLVPATPSAHGHRLERLAAHLGHGLIYAVMLVIFISGYLISTADGQAISVFGWFGVPALVTGLPNQATVAGDIHWYAAWTLMVLVLGHTLAAFKHHFVDRQDTLVRMLSPRFAQRPPE
ncbi:cytochrome b [Modicisalibacter radicis]|uniref:cytochrome b n=1 Tax=Halomonas sp. EAR18 TaxID=2518972 RepID=UPI00109C1FD9|nr:cytochrome b [Halomonas sp. EAR18]